MTVHIVRLEQTEKSNKTCNKTFFVFHGKSNIFLCKMGFLTTSTFVYAWWVYYDLWDPDFDVDKWQQPLMQLKMQIYNAPRKILRSYNNVVYLLQWYINNLKFMLSTFKHNFI